jgi:hypothetical protein
MSAVIIRQLLETAATTASAGLATAYENVPYTTIPNVPFQRLDLLLGTPVNPTFDAFYREVGFLQVSLCYPLGNGSGAATTQAQLLRTAFPQGRTLVSGKVTLVISGAAYVLPSSVDDDRFVIPVRIPFYANVLP